MSLPFFAAHECDKIITTIMAKRRRNPHSLSVLLKDPTAEWTEIRAAMKATAQGSGVCTNYAVMKALSASKSDGSAESSSDEDNCKSNNGSGNLVQQEQEDSKAAVVENEQPNDEVCICSNSGPSATTQAQVEQSMEERIKSNNSDSLMPLNNTGGEEDITNSRNRLQSQRSSRRSTSGANIADSINLMSFGVCHKLLLDEEESDRSCQDERSERSCQSSLEEVDDVPSSSTNDGLILSWKRDGGSFNKEDLDGSIRSEGDLDNFVDSSGFLDWPAIEKEEAATEASDTKETSADDEPKQEEDWNIEDYDGSERSGGSTKSINALVRIRTLKMFSRKSSNCSSTASSSQEGIIDVSQVRAALLKAKNGRASIEEEGKDDHDNDEKPTTIIPRRLTPRRLAPRRMTTDGTTARCNSVSSPTNNGAAATDDDKTTNIWIRGRREESCRDFDNVCDLDLSDEYNEIYFAKAKASSEEEGRSGGFMSNLFEAAPFYRRMSA